MMRDPALGWAVLQIRRILLWLFIVVGLSVLFWVIGLGIYWDVGVLRAIKLLFSVGLRPGNATLDLAFTLAALNGFAWTSLIWSLWFSHIGRAFRLGWRVIRGQGGERVK